MMPIHIQRGYHKAAGQILDPEYSEVKCICDVEKKQHYESNEPCVSIFFAQD
jgi:hypothetical protein